jgi:hypoxia-inducible factor 1-alpha inhibitor (HIF hydroxylase)
VQTLDETGAILNDASLAKVQPEFEEGVSVALHEWMLLPVAVPGLTLRSVYLRGSIPRGLALPGLSDVDTVGFATYSPDLPKADVYKQKFPAMAAWKALASQRDERIRDACPACTGLEMKLILVPEDSGPGRWLSGKDKQPLTPAQEDELDLFRLQSHGVCLYGEPITARLAPSTLRPRLALALQADLEKAEKLVDTCEIDVETDCDSEAMRIARWAGKRTLRAGMEIAAPTLGYYSRDLLPCHRAIEKALGEAAASKSLEVLQLTCMSEAEVRKRGVSSVIHELLEACEQLRDLYPSPR